MRERISRRRRERDGFLRRLYDVTGARVSEFVDAFGIAADLDIASDELRGHLEYFSEKGWVVVDDYRAGIIRITAAGIDHVEDLCGG